LFGAAASKKTRILLAEDDDDFRWALADFLKEQGYEVTAASNGSIALEHIVQAMSDGEWPHVVVTDLRMPGVTGMELLRDLRKRGLSAPVVMISAFGDEGDRREAKALGANAFLDKPLAPAHLQTVIRQVLN
jgi:CheY-like chemotaxis protein